MRAYSLDDLAAYREERPPVLISRLLTRGSKLFLAAKSKSQKSFVLHSLLYALGTGTPVFGCPEFTVPQPEPGVLFSQELGAAELQRRWVTLLADRLAPDVLRLLRENVFLLPRNLTFRLESQRGRAEMMAAIQSVVERTGRVSWIALDPISKLHTLNENEQHQVSLIIRGIEEIQEHFEKPAVIAVHHHGHPTEMKLMYRSAGALMRGSSYIYQDADCVVTLHRRSPAHARSPVFTLEFETRMGEPLLPGRIQLDGDSMLARWQGWEEVKDE